MKAKKKRNERVSRIIGLFLILFGLYWVAANIRSVDATLWLGLAFVLSGILGRVAFRRRFVPDLMAVSLALALLWSVGEVSIRIYIIHNQNQMFANQFRWMKNSELKYTFRPGVQLDGNMRANSFGMCDREFSLRKPKGVFRIAVIGDSVTARWNENSYPERLKNIFAKCNGPVRYEVMNFGVVGYNTLQEAAMVKSVAMRFSPDLIILGYVLNDPYPELAVSFTIIGHSKILAFLQQRTELFKSVVRKDESFENFIVRLHRENSAWRDVVQRGFGTIQTATRGKHVPVVVVIFPVFQSFDSPRLKKIYRSVESEARSHGFDAIQLLPEFRRYDPDKIRLPGDIFHPKPEGHELAARVVFCRLRSYWPRCASVCGAWRHLSDK